MRKENTYYIAVGAESKYYTLRYTEGGYFVKDIYINQKDCHIKNLSTSKEEALLKAKQYIDKRYDNLDEEIHEQVTNKIGERSSNIVFDGRTLCYGRKFNGQLISNILNDDFGFKYLAEGYGFPSKPCNAQLECREYVRNLPEIKAYYAKQEVELREQEKEANKALNYLLKSKFVGNENETIDIDVKITAKFWFDGMYGQSCCLKMVDMNDNQLIAYSTAKWIGGVEENDTIKVSALIKKHNLVELSKFDKYTRDMDTVIMQTQLTRIKLVEAK